MANDISHRLIAYTSTSQQIWDTVSDRVSSVPSSLNVRPFVGGLYQCCDSLANRILYPTNNFREAASKGNELRERRLATVSNEVIEIKRNPVEEERQKEERKAGELREEVEKLRTMKVKLEAYVAARPKLQEECSRALEKDPKVIDTATPVSLDGIDEEGRLMIERNNLRYDLEVRLNFIMAYKNVYDSFKEHLAQEGLPEIEWSSYGK